MKDDPGAAFAALKQPAVDALARILYMKHATTKSKTLASCDTWLKLQRFHIAALHEASIRRQGTLSLMADVFIRGAFSRPHEVLQAQGTAALCRSHRALNPHVLSALMALVTEEATVRADRVRARLQEQKETKQPQQREDVGEEAAERWLRSMSSITVLWMGKTRWEDEMQRALDVSVPQCARHHDCAACKLAIVGGSKQFLMDLRTSLLARRHLHLHDVEGKRTAAAAAPQPPLLRMVEAWIDRCYDARRQRHIRDESDLMVGIVAKLLGAQMSAGGAAESRRKEGRGHTRRGWRMPMMELKEEAYVLGGASGGREDDDVDNDDEYAEEDGWIAGRWRPRRRTGPREGYSQYLPNSLIIRRVDSIETARATIDSSRAAENAPSASAYRQPVCDSENSNDEDAHGRLDDHCPPAPPCRPLQPMPPSHRRRSTRLGVDVAAEAGASLNVPGEPQRADHERHILRSQSSLCSEAPLSDIYDAYHDSDSAGARSSSTTLHSPSSLFTQSVSGVATVTVAAAAAPPSPSEYSSVEEEAKEMQDAVRQRCRDDVPSPPPPPPPRHGQRPRSGIPVPTRTGGRWPPAVIRESDEPMYMLSLLGLGRDGKQRRTAAMKSGRCARRG
ncbi:hypothetical protein LEL_08068 [Akanthomyces lecanii RCEF 1005]|uniref:Uncharacterized protein n=1 Tax=Akanthomyces lecanii RCEF 1005 TaxID=1081108 RepID=A0A168F0G1_CORDF|nr:hypothetical protein LEL_08068 [Akanthomyces lecanii RCEF 1005]